MTRRLDVALAIIAVVAQVVVGAVVLGAVAGGYQAHDYLAYRWAVEHLTSGQPVYDPTAVSMGSLGLFLYPPTFLVLILPLAPLSDAAAEMVWMATLFAASVVAILVLPVTWRVRWLVLAIEAFFYPAANGLAQGQVGPILLLLAALGWRWLEKPARLGTTMAIGAAIKLQPAVLVGWAIVTGRRRAAVVAVVVFGLVAVLATLIAGPGSWPAQMSSLARTSDPILTANGLGAGRLAFTSGASVDVARALQLASLVATVGVAVVLAWQAPATVSYLAAVVASQLLSPVLWPHYAVVLLLPLAWLLDRNRWQILVIPIALSIPLAPILPEVTSLVAYWVVLLALAWEGLRDRRPAAVPEVA